jgi:hypothetical protein
VTVTGGWISLNQDTPNATGLLRIIGAFSMTGGTLNVKVSGLQSSDCDTISVAGEITLGRDATLTVTWIGNGAAPDGTTVYTWGIMYTTVQDTTVTGDFGNSLPPPWYGETETYEQTQTGVYYIYVER